MNGMMFNPIEELVPEKVMVFYASDENHYVEVGTIENNEVVSSKPATLETLSFLKDLCIPQIDEKKPIKMVSNHKDFLKFDNDINDTCIIWSSPQQVRNFEWKGVEYTYNCPRLIWIYKGGKKVRVFAHRHRTELHHVPLPNIYQTGSICWGNVKFPKFRTSEDVKSIEELFWNSKFTGHLNKKNCRVRLEEFHKSEEKFQHGCYVKADVNIKDLV